MRFRPCIDLHDGAVKQIVGSSLRDDGSGLQTNFAASQPPEYYADMYYRDGLTGGHVIMLGPGNTAAAKAALSVHPGNLQVGGGINPDNAAGWLDHGADKVIVTSYMFTDGELDQAKLRALAAAIPRERLVLDLSCRPVNGQYHVTCNRWQTICSLVLNQETFTELAQFCSEFLVHAVDVEGKQSGIDQTLVERLAVWSPLPVTYAGGVHCMADIDLIANAGQRRIDYTVGSALDIFGGTGIRYQDLIAIQPPLDRKQP